jgi:hypothetical protein
MPKYSEITNSCFFHKHRGEQIQDDAEVNTMPGLSAIAFQFLRFG